MFAQPIVFYENTMQDEDNFLSKIASCEDSELGTVIKDVHKYYTQAGGSELIQNWRKSSLIYALLSFKVKFYNLSRTCLADVFEEENKISNEKWHADKLSKQTATVDDKLLKEEIDSL